MIREDPYRVQAESQRKRIVRVENLETEKEEKNKELPSRSSVHQKKKKKKAKTPIITFLAIIFILLPIILLTINKNYNNLFSSIVPANTPSNQFEKIDMEKGGNSKQSDVENKAQLDDTPNDSNSPRNEIIEKDQESVNQKEESSEVEIVETEEKQTTTNEIIDTTNQEKEESTNKDKGTPKQETVSTQKTEDKIIYHTVAQGETLYRIAMKYYQSKQGIDRIKEANQLISNEIHAGQTLKIPLNN
jgi:LysM repeat protein